MRFPRASGILLHPTSLPSRYGIGDFGAGAYHFVDFLCAAGQQIWQILPLGPTGYGDSPYQCFSAFAGNPLLISPDILLKQGYLHQADLGEIPAFPADAVDYGWVIGHKLPLLEKSLHHFLNVASIAEEESFRQFCEQHREWLDDYALFMAVKKAHQGAVWTDWDKGIALRQPKALVEWQHQLERTIEALKFGQFLFYRQWGALRRYCRDRQIRIMGDMPIYVAHDSADVWAHRHLFQLDETGRPTVVAGVPPDYFSATGQLWGNPIYQWQTRPSEVFHWWTRRFQAVLELFDIVRLDHFRGFEAYWEVPAGEPTAVKGRWVQGPGASLFEHLQSRLGELPIVAENLGLITPAVEEIRNQFGFPGMSVLQFAFSSGPHAPLFLPHNYPREVVAYTGTHDNDTTLGWWTGQGAGDTTRSPEEVEQERARVLRYFNSDGRDIHWVFIRALMASVADTVLIPLQDILGAGNEARMNLPGRPGGNWRWRFQEGQLNSNHQSRLLELATLFERTPLPQV